MAKYFALFIVICGVFLYVSFQGEAAKHRDRPPGEARFQAIHEHIAMLERRRMRYFRDVPDASARPVAGRGAFAAAGRAAAMGRPGGTYASGYGDGFRQGYFIGEYLSSRRVPNPLFFLIPSPR